MCYYKYKNRNIMKYINNKNLLEELRYFKKNNEKRDLSEFKTQQKRVNKKTVILMILLLIIISSLIGALFTFMPKFFYQPLEQILIPMLVMGSIFLVGGISLIIFFESKEKNKLFCYFKPHRTLVINKSIIIYC